MRGFTVVPENGLGFCAVSIHYSADPWRDINSPDPEKAEAAAQWFDANRRAWPDPNDWNREFELNFYAGAGARVFPQYTELTHSRGIPTIRRRVLIRGWDFGWHCPVCVVMQIDGESRLCVLREYIGGRQTTKDFAQHVLDRCAADFSQTTGGWEDFCDPAGQQMKSLESEKSEKRDVDVLTGMGIFARSEYGWSRRDGRSLIHQLLAIRGDGTPGFYLDPTGAPILHQAFLGRYVYPESKDGKVKEEPDDATHPFADVMAALRYVAIGVHGRLGLRRLSLTAAPGPSVLYQDVEGYSVRRPR